MKNVVGARLQKHGEPGAMGVVKDTRYIRCFWPHLKAPTKLFAEGSSGIEVMGPPTPRNVVFPPDTVFLDRVPDSERTAEEAVRAVAGPHRKIINLLDDLGDTYWDALQAEAPKVAARHPTNGEAFHLEETGEPTEREPKGARFVAPLTKKEADDLVEGRAIDADMRKGKQFIGKAGAVLDRKTMKARAR